MSGTGGWLASNSEIPPWKLRFQQDFPWLYDFPRMEQDLANNVDLVTLYKRIWAAVHMHVPEKQLALTNRYLIWKVIEWVADVHLDDKEGEDQGQPDEPATLVDAVSTPMAPPTCVELEHSIHEETLLLRDFNKLPTTHSSTKVGRAPLGELKSITGGYVHG